MPKESDEAFGMTQSTRVSGKKVDGRIEGLNLPESAIGFGESDPIFPVRPLSTSASGI